MNKLTTEEKTKIQAQAKQIIHDFSKALESVEIEEKKFKKSTGGYREESNGKKTDIDFRKAIFANAPHKNENNILAETKSW
jgi:hypothetical protein